MGSAAVKAVELTLEGSEPVLTGFGSASITAEGGAPEAVAQALAGLKGRARRCVAGVGGQ